MIKNDMLKNSIIRGCLGAAVSVVLFALWVISLWSFDLPYYTDYLVIVLLADVIFFFLKNDSLNYFGISCSVFLPIILMAEIILIVTGVYHNFFKLLFGNDSVMDAGDGFMIMASFIELAAAVAIGTVSSFVWTFVKSGKVSKKQIKQGQIKSALFGRKEEIIPMYLIVGLGNPGKQYDMTRHNIGFHTIDYIADKYGAKLTKLKFKAVYGEATISGEKVYLVKPQTYMNLSGDSVGEMAQFYKIPPENIIVINDDISLDVGRIRVRPKGSAGGHNGLKSIIYRLNSDTFPRVKMGVGAPKHEDYDLADFVLGRFTKEEIPVMEDAIIKAEKAVSEIIKNGVQSAMNKYNGK